ncbi:major facilitator superfamily domain-containing protein [Crucibulum laeve]|uniref:Major facilitator superfamily domain-containing protein n=1 Tax=Crucibulum laeve TaxID=68775 RepID=A0A5C3LF38_9AGAR|nr:major facilitator superfamily domain-containing protein [Crucibulum laeve]
MEKDSTLASHSIESRTENGDLADTKSIEDELDPALNPLNWSTSRKWVNLTLVTAQSILASIGCTLLAVGARDVSKDLHITSPSISALPVAVYVLGLGFGPLYLAPLSEMYGRRNIYLVSFMSFTLLNVGCAFVTNKVGLIVLRFLAGLASSAGPTIGGATIGDLFRRAESGAAQAFYTLGPTLGPPLGGVFGAYIAQRGGWRWEMWALTIGSGILTVLCILFLPETYKPFIHARSLGKRRALAQIGFRRSLTRPIRILVLQPIVTIMSLYMAVVYGIFYLHVVTIPLLFGPVPMYGLFSYQWKDGNDGLAYLGVATGCSIALVICFFTMNGAYRALCNKYQCQKPEFRTPYMQIGVFIIPVGLFIYGWTAEFKLHFGLPLFGACVFASGMLVTFISFQSYMVDAFGDYSASALAAATVMRSIVGAVFCISGQELYKGLGYGWGTSVLGFISCMALPIPYLIWKYGERLRAKPFQL